MADDKQFNNPFGALGHLRGAPPASPAASEKAPAGSAGTKTYPRAVVRMERAGRRGKEVTVIEHVALSQVEREQWLQALKAGLGCGGTIEGETLVLQGDQRTRLPALLSSRGVKKITVS